ncbi:hypothetical protein GGF37_001435 [Kickxella alabastrina]|nr:hypothetical protein GGF37_001435 [Kickxella alabastrina]
MQQTPISNAASLFLAALTSTAPSSTSVPTYSLPAESITPAPVPETTSQTLNSDINSESSHYMSDDWSPFNMPAVKQCVSSGIQQQQEPLLGQMASTPIYTPMYTPPYPMSCDPQDAFEGSELFTKKTYAGYRFPYEDVTVRIMDIDSGEFLKHFPHR